MSQRSLRQKDAWQRVADLDLPVRTGNPGAMMLVRQLQPGDPVENLLWAAAQTGQDVLLQAIIGQAGPPDQWVERALGVACQSGYVACARVALDGALICNAARGQGLWKAAQGGWTECVNLIIERAAESPLADNAVDLALVNAAKGGFQLTMDAVLQAFPTEAAVQACALRMDGIGDDVKELVHDRLRVRIAQIQTNEMEQATTAVPRSATKVRL